MRNLIQDKKLLSIEADIPYRQATEYQQVQHEIQLMPTHE
jgi:hypothetical protein